jgi:quercetin dioxygenase-like cupin family protein
MTTDTTIKKVDSRHSPTGEMGQKYLASGVSLAMRLWESEQPSVGKDYHSRPYETVGYVISGRAKLHIGDQVATLNTGDSWVVPKGARHKYEILEPFTALEASHPPAHIEGRDQQQWGAFPPDREMGEDLI